MESTSKKRPLDLPSSLNKPPMATRPLTMASPSGSINVRKHQFLLNHGEASSSGSKSCRTPFSAGKKASAMEVKQSKKNETPCLTLEQAIEYELKCGRQVDPSMDTKKLRRTISNRLSAQRSRMRKVQYIHDMELKVKELQDTISLLSPQLASYTRNQKMLRMQKTMLQQQLENCMEKSKLCNKQIEENKIEVKRLRELHNALRKHDFNSEKEKLSSTSIYQSVRPPLFFASLHQSNRLQQHPPSLTSVKNMQQHGEVEQYLNLDAFNNLDLAKNEA